MILNFQTIGTKLILHVVLAFATQVFTSIQEKAIESEMAATKDVSMEPTIKSLNDDLVRD